MGLQSAMTTSLTGLQAAETVIDVVGNNVANSSTVGFKQSDVLFATQFLQTQSIGSAPSDARGGTNPRQIGLGVKVAAINPDFAQGTIQISSNPLDVAIQGDGFLIVQGSQGEKFYSRNGQIQTNSSNQLVTSTGNRVLGFTVDEDFNIVDSGEPVPLSIPLGEVPVTQPTQTAFFTGVLTPLAEVGDTPSVISSEILGDVTLDFPDPDAVDIGDLSQTTAPSGLATAANLAGTNLAPGAYDYRMTYVLTSGSETYESAPSGIVASHTVTAGPTQDIALSNLPVDGSGDWTGRNLYRRMDGGDYELVATLDTTTTTYNDTTAAPAGPVLDETALEENSYSYYVTWTVNGVESRPTAQIGSFSVTGVDGRIRIDNLPQPPNPTDSINIYRNVGTNSSEFHLVDTVAAGTTTYIDNSPDSAIEGNQELDLIGPKATGGTFVKDLVIRDGDTYSTPFADVPGTLEFTGRRGGRTLGTKELAIDSTTTVSELLTFMEQAFGIIDPGDDDPFAISPGASIANGVIDFTSNMGLANALSINLSSFQFTPASETDPVSIPISFTESDESEQNKNGAGSTTDFVVFDSLGTPVNVRITTVMEEKTANSTTYRWFATSEDNEPTSGVSTAVGTGTIRFDGNGAIQAGGVATISVQRNQSASESPLVFDLDFSQVSGLALQNNLGESSSTLNMVRQDGFPPGTLTSFIITESGLIRGIFSNGAERPLGQIRMSRFANNAGLQQVGENLFAQGVNSGEPVNGDPGENGIGTLTAGALELSNTDIGQNLIDLILASTQYRGGARVITTAQQLLEELLNLRR
jgi:flagellar hook protein FlgE